MFKKSSTNRQIDFLSNFSMNLDQQRAEILSDSNAWYNQFYEHVVCRIDESCFEVLYHDHMGRPNASVRTLLAMMALKEGFGWSDSQLYQQVHFNLMVMKALGFENLSDKAPASSTYYLFKQAVYNYRIEHGRDLIHEAFKSLTKDQARYFDVDGEKIHMDSKLIGSNIVRCSRLQLIVSCLQEFWKSLSDDLQNKLDAERREILDALCSKKPHQIVYPLSEEEKSQQLVDLGELLYYLHRFYDESDSDKHSLIERLLNEQYQIEGDKTVLKPGKEIPADSIQSPHDPDAAYRRKSSKTVNGHSINVTETCNDEGLNLIVDIQTEKATTSDKDYVPPALDNARDVVGDIKEAYMDGAYQSPDNNEYGKTNHINLIFTGIQGTEGNFEFIKTETGLQVLNRQTGEITDAIEYKPNHYKIQLPSGKWRYFKPEHIESFDRRQTIEGLPREVKNRRNNVEATIFQLSYHTRNNKTRYRGQFRNRVWAISRSIWINLIRIRNHVKEQAQQGQPAVA